MANIIDQLTQAADAQDKATAGPWFVVTALAPSVNPSGGSAILGPKKIPMDHMDGMLTEDAHFIALCRSLPLREIAALVEMVAMRDVHCQGTCDSQLSPVYPCSCGQVAISKALAALEAAVPSQGDAK